MSVSCIEVDDEEKEKIAREISINSSQYSHELWRCNRINAVSWVIKMQDFISEHSSFTHLMLISWASIWSFDNISKMKMKMTTKLKAKAKMKDENIEETRAEWQEKIQLDWKLSTSEDDCHSTLTRSMLITKEHED